jgi:hypothetical protein
LKNNQTLERWKIAENPQNERRLRESIEKKKRLIIKCFYDSKKGVSTFLIRIINTILLFLYLAGKIE